MIEFIVQCMIFGLGAVAIALLAAKSGRTRRWGYVVGVCSEPFWIYSAYFAEQWGVILLALWWGWFYTKGAINNWSVE